jgi:hypothetical protein
MTLTDTFVKKVKPIKKGGEKYTDGDGMYILVTPIGKYWRLDYRYLGKRKTLALGVYRPLTKVAIAVPFFSVALSTTCSPSLHAEETGIFA